jgi:hypothetical protein
MTPSHISYKKGQAILAAVVFFVITSLSIVVCIAIPVAADVGRARELARSRAALFTSESLNDDVAYRLKHGLQIGTSETLAMNGSSATSTITTVSTNEKRVQTTGSFGVYVRKIETKFQTGSGASFFYGVQVGQGGFVMENSSSITGNLYAN